MRSNAVLALLGSLCVSAVACERNATEVPGASGPTFAEVETPKLEQERVPEEPEPEDEEDEEEYDDEYEEDDFLDRDPPDHERLRTSTIAVGPDGLPIPIDEDTQLSYLVTHDLGSGNLGFRMYAYEAQELVVIDERHSIVSFSPKRLDELRGMVESIELAPPEAKISETVTDESAMIAVDFADPYFSSSEAWDVVWGCIRQDFDRAQLPYRVVSAGRGTLVLGVRGWAPAAAKYIARHPEVGIIRHYVQPVTTRG
ncbi:MAG: hypothetical protein AAF799_10570 [Myxococcota bacterium]